MNKQVCTQHTLVLLRAERTIFLRMSAHRVHSILLRRLIVHPWQEIAPGLIQAEIVHRTSCLYIRAGVFEHGAAQSFVLNQPMCFWWHTAPRPFRDTANTRQTKGYYDEHQAISGGKASMKAIISSPHAAPSSSLSVSASISLPAMKLSLVEPKPP